MIEEFQINQRTDLFETQLKSAIQQGVITTAGQRYF